MLRELAHQQLGHMAQARTDAADFRPLNRAWSCAVGEFVDALERFVLCIKLSEAL